RPGRTAFANSPTENAEKTRRKRGWGGGIAWLMTIDHATARTSTETRLSAMAATTHCHRTIVNASPTAPQSGPRHQTRAPTPAADGGPPPPGAAPGARGAGAARPRWRLGPPPPPR